MGGISKKTKKENVSLFLGKFAERLLYGYSCLFPFDHFLWRVGGFRYLFKGFCFPEKDFVFLAPVVDKRRFGDFEKISAAVFFLAPGAVLQMAPRFDEDGLRDILGRFTMACLEEKVAIKRRKKRLIQLRERLRVALSGARYE